MSFLQKLFDRKKEEVSQRQPKQETVAETKLKQETVVESKPKQEEVTEPQQIPEEPIPSSSKQEEKYKYEFALTNEVIRKCIIDEFMPVKEKKDILNLQLAYGVLNPRDFTFVTLLDEVIKADDDTGENYSIETFVALVKDKSIRVSCKTKYRSEDSKEEYDVPTGYEEMLIPAMKLWRDKEKYESFEQEIQKQDNSIRLSRLNSEYTAPLYDLVPREKDPEKKHIEFRSFEEAKAWFFENDMPMDFGLKKYYDDATLETYYSLLNKEQKRQWVREDAEKILRDIIAGNTDKLYRKLEKFRSRCSHWDVGEDCLADIYTEMCNTMFHSNKYVPMKSINSYLSLFSGSYSSYNPIRIAGLLDIVENYVESDIVKKKVQESEDCKCDLESLRKRCDELRRKLNDYVMLSNVHDFEFVSMSVDVQSKIINYYLDKYGDIESVKEILVEFNSLYGVQNEEIYITALRDACDKMDNESFEKYIFIVVMLKTGEIEELRCVNDKETGRLHTEFPTKIVPETLANAAVMFYRNQLERQKFFEQIYPGEKYMFIKVSQARREFMKSLGSSFQNLLDRIGDNPLKDTLEKFIEMCEEKLPDYGIERMKINEPATEEEIEAWEMQNEIKLPESYRNFLMFANGFRFRGCSEYIVGLDGIDLHLSHLEPDYMYIGEMIGDGATLCLSKSTGEAYVEDHGEYKKKGDFKDLLEYLIDFMY